LHELGVRHNDLSPKNIWVQSDGSVKLLDLEFSELAEDNEDPMGYTPAYAPWRDSQQYLDRTTDQFALGVILFYLATGKEYLTENQTTRDTFGYQSLTLNENELKNKISEQLDPHWEWITDIVYGAVADPRNKRFASVQKLMEAYQSSSKEDFLY